MGVGLADFFEEILELEGKELSNEELILIANIRKPRSDIKTALYAFIAEM